MVSVLIAQHILFSHASRIESIISSLHCTNGRTTNGLCSLTSSCNMENLSHGIRRILVINVVNLDCITSFKHEIVASRIVIGLHVLIYKSSGGHRESSTLLFIVFRSFWVEIMATRPNMQIPYINFFILLKNFDLIVFF